MPDSAHTILFNHPSNLLKIFNIIISILWMKAEAARVCLVSGWTGAFFHQTYNL